MLMTMSSHNVHHLIMNYVSSSQALSTCTDVLSWMNLNNSKLMLKAEKTEVIAVGTSSCLRMVDKNSANFGG